MKTAFINATLLNGMEDMVPVPEQTVVIEGEKIIAVGPNVDVAVEQRLDEEDVRIVDLKGKYLMPGLINLHVHIPASGKAGGKETSDPKKKIRLMTRNNAMRKIMDKICEGYMKTELYSGVTTLRGVGGVEDVDSRLRDRIERNEVPGPRILAANMAVSVPGGHMAGSLAYEATSAEEAVMYVEKIASEKPDLIKLMITGGVLDAKVKGEPGELKMPPEYVKAACDAAHARGLMVAAHVESPEGVKVALQNGVDTIEHGAKPDEEMIALFKERGAALVATLSPALPYALFDREISGASEMEQYNGDVVFQGIIDCAKGCLEAGIPVGLGTDTGCPYVTHYNMWRELLFFHNYCGVSNSFALHTATQVNAKIVGIDDITGTIEAGKCADIIVTAKNPLDTLQALREIDMVVARGRITTHPKVKKMADVEKELDKFL